MIVRPKGAKRIINFDKICRSYSDLNFGVTFLEHSVVLYTNRKLTLNDLERQNDVILRHDTKCVTF